MTKIYDPLVFPEASAPSNPASIERAIYNDSTTHKMSLRTPEGGSILLEGEPRYGRFVVYGHSIPAGGGVSDSALTTSSDRDIMTHLAAMFGMREVNRSTGGAVLHYNQQNAFGDGGYAKVLQSEVRKSRAQTTLSALANAGSATISVTSATGFNVGDAIHVGTGSTAASGGEVLFITTIVGTTLTVSRGDGTTTTARTHQSGEPVFAVPTAYINQNPLYLLWYGLNDLGKAPVASTTNVERNAQFKDALELAIARCRCAEVYENDHVSCVYSGTWAGVGASTASNSGPNIRQATAVNAAVTINVPDNFPGGTVVLGWAAAGTASTTAPVWSVSVDGGAATTKSIYRTVAGLARGFCIRLTGLAAGRHSIVATITTLGAGAQYFDWWGIEATIPPLIVVPNGHRPLSYSIWTGSPVTWPNGYHDTTLTGVHGIGSSTITVASTSGMLYSTTVTFEPGTGNEETIEASSTAPTDGTHFNLASATTKSHGNGTTVRYGMQEPDVPKLNTHIQSVVSGFDAYVVYVDIDTFINKQQKYLYYDGAHLNDLGHADAVNYIAEYIQRVPGVTQKLTSYTGVPTSPHPSALVFDTDGPWAGMPVSRTEVAQGTTTYTPPGYAGALRVRCVAAGAGGGGTASSLSNAGAGGGGGAGGTSEKWVPGPVKASYTVAVGLHGNGGASGANNGTAGGDTTFDSPSICTAKGGSPGSGSAAATSGLRASGAGGVTSSAVGDVLIAGGPGAVGIILSGTVASGGNGGNSSLGGGGQGAVSASSQGAVGGQWGAGGSGASQQNNGGAQAGSNGADGRIIVEEFAEPGTWWQMPSALTELFGNTQARHIADLRRCVEAKLVVNVMAAGLSGSGIRAQYSLDAGTTWKYIDRTALYAEGTGLEALLTTTGRKDSGWSQIAAEAIEDGVLLRLVGINGNGTASPVIGSATLYFR